MLNFVDENKYPKFCEKLRNVLLLIDLATLGGDFVTNSMLKKAAQEALDATPPAIRNDKRWTEAYLTLCKLANITASSKYIRLYRVQGGKEISRGSKFRFWIKDNKVIIEGDDMVHLTFDDKTRVAYFWTKQGKEAEVFTAEVTKEFVDKIRREAVTQIRAREFPNRPQIDDPTKTIGSFGIHKSYFKELLENIRNPQIIKNELQ